MTLKNAFGNLALDSTLQGVETAVVALTDQAGDLAQLADTVQSTASVQDDLSLRTRRDVLDPAHPSYVPLPTAPAGIDAPGQQLSRNSFPVVLPSEQVDDLNLSAVIPAGTQSVGMNAVTASGQWVDVSRYRSFLFQGQCPAGVTVSYVVEFSNDGAGVLLAYMIDANSPGAYPAQSVAQTASTNRFWEGPIKARYFRVRISTAVAGGAFATFTRLSMAPWVSSFNPVFSNTLVTPNNSASGTNATVTAAGSGIPTNSVYLMGGIDTSAPTNPISTSPPRSRAVRTDPLGNQTIVGPDQTTFTGVSNNPVMVKNAPGDGSSWSERDLLTMILAELRAQNLYLKELPRVLSAGATFTDEPQDLVADQTLIM